MQRQGPTQSLKPAWILGSAHGHVHKLGEKKERNSLTEYKNQGNLTHRVRKEKRGSPQKQGFPGGERGTEKICPPHMVVGCYQRANELGIAIPGPD